MTLTYNVVSCKTNSRIIVLIYVDNVIQPAAAFLDTSFLSPIQVIEFFVRNLRRDTEEDLTNAFKVTYDINLKNEGH